MSFEHSDAAPAVIPPLPSTPPARIDALHVAGRVAIVGLGLLITFAAVDVVVAPMAATAVEADPTSVLTWVELGLAVIQLVVILGTAAAFITWLYIAMKNLSIWQIIGHGWTPGWAIGGWFIPLANLVLPALVVNAALRGSAASPNQRYAAAERPGLIWGWWATFILAGCWQNNAARKNFTGQDVASVAAYTAIGSFLYIVSAVLAILIIRRITTYQDQRQQALDAPWQRILTQQPPPPPIA